MDLLVQPKINANDVDGLQFRNEGLALTVYGDGKQMRSYTLVSDVVEAYILAATARVIDAPRLARISAEKAYAADSKTKRAAAHSSSSLC